MAQEAATPRVERRLAAIMAADVVGYSRLMGTDEEGTLAQLRAHRRGLVDPKIKEHYGRIVKTTGDGLLVEFVSPVEAVRCAVEIQRGMVTRNSDVPQGKRITFRMGINLGDVIAEEGDLFGDGVNVSARLEALCEPGGTAISRTVRDQIRDKLPFVFTDAGEHEVKNIARPVRVYALTAAAIEALPEAQLMRSPQSIGRPRGAHRVKNIPYPIHVYEVAYERIRATLFTWFVAHWIGLAAAAGIGAIAIASVLIFREQTQDVARTNTIMVLPFKNVDGNTADDYLADAITDDLTTELSRLRRAWVIASGTAFTYKDKPKDPRQIGRELHVRYVLGGSVRRAGPIVQLNAQLIDTESGTNLWADSFAYETSSLHDLQDNLMGRIATSLSDEVTKAGVQHEVGTLAADYNPLDERMRAMAAIIGFPTAEKYLETRHHAEAGLQADPDNARLLALLANVLTGDVLNGWNGAGKPEVDRAEAAAKKAISLDHDTPVAHFALGYVHRLHGSHQAAFDAFNEAVKIDPNYAIAYAQTANEMVFLGDAKGAIPLSETAAQLSPNDPSFGVFLWVKGRAYFTLGDYPKAIEVLEESVRVRPNLWFTQAWLIAAYALANRDVEARQRIKAFKQTFGKRSDLNWITQYYKEEQYQNPTMQAASAELLNGLRKAGLN